MGDEVLGDDLVLGPVENALHRSGGGLLNLGDDIGHGSRLFKLDSEISDGDVGGGDAEGHTGQLAVQGGDNLVTLFSEFR